MIYTQCFESVAGVSFPATVPGFADAGEFSVEKVDGEEDEEDEDGFGLGGGGGGEGGGGWTFCLGVCTPTLPGLGELKAFVFLFR